MNVPTTTLDRQLEFPAGPGPARKVHVRTFGCQMNVYDSERMAEALSAHGYECTDAPEDADLVLLNTCHIREKSAEKVYSDLGRMNAIKVERSARGLRTAIAVAGCVAQAEGGLILARAPGVDVVVGPQSYHRLPDLVAEAARSGKPVVDTELPAESKFEALPRSERPRSPCAFLTVQEGCDKFCTFCVVPYTRGAEQSRPVDRIVAEAETLARQGVRELTLLGQNVNAYHGEGPDGGAWSLARLLDRLAAVDGLLRLRYVTSHPRDMRDDLIRAHRDNPKLMPYLHLPIQSGSDRILAAMNRRHRAKDYLALVERIRDCVPAIALSTDVIVGFPGETDADFKATIDLVERVGFAQGYSFKYSARPGTPAALLDDAVAAAVQQERLARLQALIDRQQSTFNAATVGKKLPVLFDRQGRRHGQIVGKTPYLQSVHAQGTTLLIGTLSTVEIVDRQRNSLGGVIIGP